MSRANRAFTPRSVSGYRDYTLSNSWNIPSDAQIGSGRPITGSPWWGPSGAISIPTGGILTSILYGIPPATPPPNTRQFGKVEASLFEVSQYPASVVNATSTSDSSEETVDLTSSLTTSVTAPSIGPVYGAYLFTGTGGTTSYTLPTHTDTGSIAGDTDGTIDVPSVVSNIVTTLPQLYPPQGIVMWMYVTSWFTSDLKWLVRDFASDPTAGALDVLDYTADFYQIPVLNTGFSGRSWSVNLPPQNEFPVAIGSGEALVVSIANLGPSTFAGVPYFRCLSMT